MCACSQVWTGLEFKLKCSAWHTVKWEYAVGCISSDCSIADSLREKSIPQSASVGSDAVETSSWGQQREQSVGRVAGVIDDPAGFPYTPPGVDVQEGGKLTSNNVADSSHDPLQSFEVASGAVFKQGGCHESGSWASLNSPPEVTHSPHGLFHYTHCCTQPQNLQFPYNSHYPLHWRYTHWTHSWSLWTHSWLHCVINTTYLNHGLPLPLCRVLFSI